MELQQRYTDKKQKADYEAAVMVFHDLSGQTLREVTLTDRGHASVTLQADGLAAGVYTYSLVADGRTVETRRMVKGN